MNLVSIIIGVIALIISLIGFIPLLGWLNWLAIFLAIIGLAIGIIAKYKQGQNLNILVLVVAGIRLYLGGGVL